MTRSFFDGAGDFASRARCAAQDVADEIGPKRGLIGLAVIAAAIGTSVLVTRYVRNRRAQSIESGFEGFEGFEGVQRRRRRRARRNDLVQPSVP